VTLTEYSEIDQGNICLLVSLDLSKAFHKVNHDILLHKMSSWYNMDVSWFKSYLRNRSQYVQHNNETSTPGKTDIGVPQGVILSCILFALLLNDLPYHLKKIFALLFADDSNFVITGNHNTILKILKKIKTTMEIIIEWMNLNRMQLNVNKT